MKTLWKDYLINEEREENCHNQNSGACKQQGEMVIQENFLFFSEKPERTTNLIKTAAPREHTKLCSPNKHLADNSITFETEIKDIK